MCLPDAAPLAVHSAPWAHPVCAESSATAESSTGDDDNAGMSLEPLLLLCVLALDGSDRTVVCVDALLSVLSSGGAVRAGKGEPWRKREAARSMLCTLCGKSGASTCVRLCTVCVVAVRLHRVCRD